MLFILTTCLSFSLRLHAAEETAKPTKFGLFEQISKDPIAQIIHDESISIQDLKQLAKASPSLIPLVRDEIFSRDPFLYWSSPAIKSHLIFAHDGPVYLVAFLANGNLVSVGTKDRMIKVWDEKTGNLIREFKGNPAGDIHHTALSPKGNIVAILYSDGTIGLWNVETGVKINEFTAPDYSYCLAITDDGKTLAVGTDNAIQLWDTSTGISRKITDFKNQSVLFIAFTPDGQTVAASTHKKISLFDVKSLNRGEEFKKIDYQIPSVSFLHNNTIRGLVTGIYTTIQDIKNKKVMANIMTNISRREQVAFSPDGKLVAMAGNDIFQWKGYSKRIEGIEPVVSAVILDIETEQKKVLVRGGTANSIAFSVNGRSLAVGYDDGTVTLITGEK